MAWQNSLIFMIDQIYFQKSLLELHKCNVTNVLSVARAKRYLEPESTEEFFNLCCITCFIRPKLANPIANLIIEATKLSPSLKDLIEQHFFLDTLKYPIKYFKSGKNLLLYHELYALGYLTKEFIQSQFNWVIFYLESHHIKVYGLIPFHLWFGDEFTYDILAKYHTNLILCRYRKQNFKHNSIFEEKRLNDHIIRNMPNPSEETIMKDDIKQIKDVSLTIPVTKFHPFMNMDVSLADLSAFYGSEKCFEYLISNNVNIEKTSLYAFAGGNQTMISKLESKCHFGEEQLNISILFHHNVLVSKIESKGIHSKNANNFASYINNAKYLTEHNLCPTLLIIKNGFLISTKHYLPSLMQKYGEKEVLNYAIRSKSTRMIDFIIRNLHEPTNLEFSLFWSIKKNNIDLVRFLISKASPNCLYHGFSPIDVALKMNNKEIIKILKKNKSKTVQKKKKYFYLKKKTCFVWKEHIFMPQLRRKNFKIEKMKIDPYKILSCNDTSSLMGEASIAEHLIYQGKIISDEKPIGDQFLLTNGEMIHYIEQVEEMT